MGASLFGVLSCIVSDQGTQFESSFQRVVKVVRVSQKKDNGIQPKIKWDGRMLAPYVEGGYNVPYDRPSD